MADRAPPPLVQLDQNGNPTVLRYDVPEPTSYSGKHYINLSQLPPEAFTTTIVSSAAEAPRLAPGGAVLGSSPASALAHPSLRIDADGDGRDGAPVVVEAREDVTERLAGLTRGQLRAMVDAGFRPVLYRASSGLLDVHVFGPGNGPKHAAELSAELSTEHRPMALLARSANGGDGADGMFLSLYVDSPADGSSVTGPATGVTITVSGTWDIEGTRGRPSVALRVDGGSETTASVSASGKAGTWSAKATITSSGSHTLQAVGSLTVGGSGGETTTLTAKQAVDVSVELEGGGEATILPSVVVRVPLDKTVVVSSSGVANVTVAGSADSNVAGQGVTVEVLDATTGVQAATSVTGGKGDWSLQLELQGKGRHAVQVTARNERATSAAVVLELFVSDQEPVRRLVSRLMIVETLTSTSFLGAYGAGRVLRTFSLLPGERTTISVKTFTQSEESRKQAASILDSTASEASSQFDDAVSREQTNKDSEAEASNYKVGAEASATWGWGSAKINAEFSGSANSAREEAVKNVTTATRKHASKASSNRSVTVNTDYEVKTQEKVEESTTREVSNINVSRTLNFTFRQLNQEHVVLIHLTNVRLAYYAEDVVLGADGGPLLDGEGKPQYRYTYREVSLPEMQSLLDAVIVPSWHDQVKEGVIRALTGIPDYNDVLQTVVEAAVPKDEYGDPVAGAGYLRFPRNLSTTWKDPGGELAFTVPGIVLSWDKVTMRTDGVIVDSVLGQGDALDTYSHGLQDQALDERRLGNERAKAQLAKEELARKIVADKDETAAELFAKVFPPPPQKDVVS
jgi:hypothetical protein